MTSLSDTVRAYRQVRLIRRGRIVFTDYDSAGREILIDRARLVHWGRKVAYSGYPTGGVRG